MARARLQERGIVGETPNLAARLQGLAEPNTVVIAESTRSCSATCLNLKTLGQRNSKVSQAPLEPLQHYDRRR